MGVSQFAVGFSSVEKDGILQRKWEFSNLETNIFQIVVPQKKIKQILEEAHDSPSGGHFTVNKLWIKFGKDFIGQRVSRMLRIGADHVKFVYPEKDLRIKENPSCNCIMLEVREGTEIFLDLSQHLLREINIY